ALDQFDLHVRYLAEAQHRIVRPAGAGDALAVEAHALLEDPACRLDRAALDLVDHAVGIDGFADIHGQCQLSHLDVFVTLDFGDGSAIGAGVLVAPEAEPVTDAGLLHRLPSG